MLSIRKNVQLLLTGTCFVVFSTHLHGDQRILLAVGKERDPEKACRMNVQHAVEVIKHAFRDHPEIPSAGLEIRGAVYDIKTGIVDWI